MALERQERYSDEGADNAHIMGVAFASLLTILCPPLGIPFLAMEYRTGKKLSSGELVTEEEGLLEEMTSKDDEAVVDAFKVHRLPHERTINITNSAVIPPNPRKNYGLFYAPGEVTRSVTYSLGEEDAS